MMKDDPTIEQIREIRRRISAMCDHDPRKFVEYYIEFQKKYRDRLVNLAEVQEDHQEEFVGAETTVG
jgi:hypothetical protein